MPRTCLLIVVLASSCAQAEVPGASRAAAAPLDPAAVAKAAAQLPKTWGERWYILRRDGKPRGYLRLGVAAKDGKLLLTDEVALPDEGRAGTLRNQTVAAPDAYLSPLRIASDARWAKKAWSFDAEVRDGLLKLFKSEGLGGEGNGGPVPAGFTTDFAVFRLVTVLPNVEQHALAVFITLTKPTLLNGAVLRFDGEERIEHDGRQVTARRFVLSDPKTHDKTYWVGAQGQLLRAAFSGSVDAVLADETRARKAAAQALQESGEKAEAAPRPRPKRDPRSDAKIPVFPGAEGYGTQTPAGRGGRVVAVTSLADDGPGSLREALSGEGPRTILFRVGGTIELKDHLYINNPFVTVAGQTAPGGGILLKGAGLVVCSHDVLLQHLRIRPGNEGPVKPETNDAVAILGHRDADDRTGAYNVVIDHCSLSWGEDEVFSVWAGATDVTLSWCILSEALNKSRHEKGTHSAGPLAGDGSDRVTLHHNIFAHNDFRNPLVSNAGSVDCVNNLVYDWGTLAAEVTNRESAAMHLNLTGNSFVAGPSTQPETWELTFSGADPKLVTQVYIEDNLGPHRTSGSAGEWAIARREFPASARAAKPFPCPAVKRVPAASLKDALPRAAGATRPRRDAVDLRIAEEIRSGTGKIVHSPSEAGGYPRIEGGDAPADGDGDGLPDAYESQAGLNSRDPADGAADADRDGYTNLEEYLHALAQSE